MVPPKTKVLMSDKITQERLVPTIPEVGEELGICHIPGLAHAPTERNRCVARTDILHRMWRDGTDFIWSTKEAAA